MRNSRRRRAGTAGRRLGPALSPAALPVLSQMHGRMARQTAPAVRSMPLVHRACRGTPGTMRPEAGSFPPRTADAPALERRSPPHPVVPAMLLAAGSHDADHRCGGRHAAERHPKVHRSLPPPSQARCRRPPTPRPAALRLFGVVARQIHIMAAKPAGGAEAPAALGQPRIVAWSQHVVAAELAEAHHSPATPL